MRLSTVCCLLSIFVGGAFGACSFSDDVKSIWWLGYDKIDQSASWMYQFTDEEIRLKVSTIQDSKFSTVYECVSSAVIDSKTYYIQKLGTQTQCVQLYVRSNAILHRRTTITLSDTVSEVGDCPAALILGWKANWLVRDPFPTSGVPCPFPQATYQTRFYNGDGAWHCDGDMGSRTVVSDTTMAIDTCYEEATSYLFPVKTTLTCLAYADSDALQGSIAQSDRGNLLLLADFSAKQFYCARYIVRGDTVYVSLRIQNSQQADCSASHDAYSAKPGVYISLVLYDVVNATTRAPTTKPGDTTTASLVPTTPTTNTPTTTTTTRSTTATGTPSTTNNVPPTATTQSTTPTPTPTTTATTTTTTTITTESSSSENTTESEGPCSNSPCANGGTCKKQQDSYYCDCAGSFRGDNCNQLASTKSSSSNKLVMIILIVVFAVVVVAVVIIAVLVCQYRHRKKEEALLSKDPSRMYLGLKNPMHVPGKTMDDENSY